MKARQRGGTTLIGLFFILRTIAQSLGQGWTNGSVHPNLVLLFVCTKAECKKDPDNLILRLNFFPTPNLVFYKSILSG